MHKNAMRRRRIAVGKRLRDCLFIGAKRREVSPSATGGEGVLFFPACKKRYQKKHAKKGYANRKGYALIY